MTLKEAGAVPKQLDLAFADAAIGLDGLVCEAVSRADDGHSEGCGIGEGIGQHGDKLTRELWRELWGHHT